MQNWIAGEDEGDEPVEATLDAYNIKGGDSLYVRLTVCRGHG